LVDSAKYEEFFFIDKKEWVSNVTNSMELSPSLEAASRSATQKFPIS
jgi:hypothetical protein